MTRDAAGVVKDGGFDGVARFKIFTGRAPRGSAAGTLLTAGGAKILSS
jgi:hypothetical protein